MNPCFYRAFNDRTLIVINQNQEIELNDGDQFALLPDHYWFEVKIQNTNLEEDNLDSDSKKRRWSTNTEEYVYKYDMNDENDNICETSLSKKDQEIKKTNNEDIKTEGNKKCNTKVIKKYAIQNANTPQPAVKVECDNNASCSGAQNTVKRERCLYGARCPRYALTRIFYSSNIYSFNFRKHQIHRAFFSHPGDRDYYKSDPGNVCTHCPYGEVCYKCNVKNFTLRRT